MYSTCIFCHHGLGTNEALEGFPVGRRIAFDLAKGRLWVVCARCGRWNLSPLEERWEVIEHCERLFRDTALRVSTENVGLARVAEGTELVRVGRPQRPELAAWRYGDRLGRRRRTALIRWGAVAAIGAPLVAMGAYGALAAPIGGGLLLSIPGWVQVYRARQGVIAKAEPESGGSVVIRGKHLPFARLLPPRGDEGRWGLNVWHDAGDADLQGPEALRVASKLLARINDVGAGDRVVQRAVERLEHGPARLFAAVAAHPRKEASYWVRYWSSAGLLPGDDPPGTLRSLALADRLALEMATHEDAEARTRKGPRGRSGPPARSDGLGRRNVRRMTSSHRCGTGFSHRRPVPGSCTFH